MPTAKGIARRPIAAIACPEGWNGHAHVRRDGTGGGTAVRVSPGVPEDQFRQVLADHEGVAGAVRDMDQLQIAKADVAPPENAVPPFQTVVRTVGPNVPVRGAEIGVRGIVVRAPVGT